VSRFPDNATIVSILHGSTTMVRSVESSVGKAAGAAPLSRYRPGCGNLCESHEGRVAPAYPLDISGEILTTSPLVGACTIWPLPRYMPSCEIGE
jgi:hypothetical protein